MRFLITYDLMKKIRGLPPEEQDRVVEKHEKKAIKVFWLVFIGGLIIMGIFVFLALKFLR